MFIRTAALAFLALISPFVSAFGQGALDPSEVYLQAHLLLQRAGKLEQTREYVKAYQKCLEANRVYEEIQTNWPAWKPDMVVMRKTSARAQFQKYEKLVKDLGLLDQINNNDALPQRSATPKFGSPKRTRPNGAARPPRTTRNRFRFLENQVAQLRNERNQLLSKLQAKQFEGRDANRALMQSQHEVNRLHDELSKTQAELDGLNGKGVGALRDQVEKLKNQLATATSSLKEANDRTSAVLSNLETANNTIAELRIREEELTEQRDEMAAIVKGLETGEASGGLVRENIQLREKLNATRAKLDDLRLDKAEADQEIFTLRQEVTDLRTELAAVQAENEVYEQRIQALENNLTDTDQALQFNPPAFDNVAAREENALLREIIQKQLKQQTHRKIGKEMVLSLLQELESGSDELLAKIEDLSKELPLTERERAVLKADGSVSGGNATIGVLPSVGGHSIKARIERYAESAAFNFEQGRYEKAVARYEGILQFAPQDIDTLCNLGVTHIRLNQLEKAKEQFEKGLLADNTHARCHYLLGVTAFHLEELEAATESFRRATESEPANADYHHFLGVAYLYRNILDEAETALKQSLELRRRFPNAHYNLALVYTRQDPPNMALVSEHYLEAKKQGMEPDLQIESNLREHEVTGAKPTSNLLPNS